MMKSNISMDREKYPNYFLAVMVLYAIVLVVGLAYFILPSIGFAGASSDFYMISFLFFLPLVLLAIYGMEPEFLWKKEGILRILITVLVVVDFIFDLYLIILLI